MLSDELGRKALDVKQSESEVYGSTVPLDVPPKMASKVIKTLSEVERLFGIKDAGSPAEVDASVMKRLVMINEAVKDAIEDGVQDLPESMPEGLSGTTWAAATLAYLEAVAKNREFKRWLEEDGMDDMAGQPSMESVEDEPSMDAPVPDEMDEMDLFAERMR